ncbi:hypothetical protein [Pseudonocardia sp. GCM10023141]|uniref:hypothetical protein n=1 Tax=Pseudonocardia sp. GCM10023141 TaxID=3252653 RepID=UPI003609CEB1
MAVRTRVYQRFSTWCFVIIAAASLAGCGAPSYNYVTNSADHTYLKIPNSWQPIDAQSINAALGLDTSGAATNPGSWVVGYDADTAPSAMHLFGPTSAAMPAAMIRVESVPAPARGQFSFDLLRDLFLPVTAQGRQQASPILTDFTLVSDDVLTPKGLHGVHTVYGYRMAGGPMQIFDQTAYLNEDASKLYVLFLRCSTECYQQRQKEITSVVSSFTVRETP